MRKIAVVDDSSDSRELLYYLLRDEYEVFRYESGEQALSQFRRDVPDLILMGIRIWEVDGFEVLQQIRRNDALRNLPVIAVTANAMAGDREKYLAAGFDEYISKPITDIDVFAETIRRLFR